MLKQKQVTVNLASITKKNIEDKVKKDEQK